MVPMNMYVQVFMDERARLARGSHEHGCTGFMDERARHVVPMDGVHEVHMDMDVQIFMDMRARHVVPMDGVHEDYMDMDV